MKEKIVNILRNVYDVLKQIGEEIIQDLKNKKEIRLNNQMAMQMQVIMEQIRNELYECLHSSNYHNLNDVTIPSNIRIVDWICAGGTTVIHYSISKNNTASPVLAHAVLQNILSNMNRDIASKTSLLLNTFGYEYMRVYYPYLYNGMQIINLKDTGFDVELEVAV